MSDLLKQAIADAKAVRATALSNAKAALEEHFTPRLQSMLSEKLAAEIAEEEAAAAAAPAPAPDAGMGAAPAPAAPAPAAPAAPAAAAPMPAAAPAAPAPDAAANLQQPPAMEEEIEEMTLEEILGTDEPELEEGMDGIDEGKKASANYNAKTKGYKTDNKGQETKAATSLSTPSLGGKASAGGRKAVDKYDGAGTQHKGGPVKDMHNKAPKLDNKGQETMNATSMHTPGGPLEESELSEEKLEDILKELEQGIEDMPSPEGHEGPEGHEDPEAPEAPEVGGVDEEVDLSEILSDQDPVAESSEDVVENLSIDDLLKEAYQEEVQEAKEEKALETENNSLKKELSEYRSAVQYLRNQINEINLLNAKLLYTNKLFKQSNFSNDQKIKIIESFDLTKSVRETKLVYATLVESMNNSGKKTQEVAKKPTSATVKTITEGLASRPVASTKPTKATVLTEGTEMANRFKKLAGIRK